MSHSLEDYPFGAEGSSVIAGICHCGLSLVDIGLLHSRGTSTMALCCKARLAVGLCFSHLLRLDCLGSRHVSLCILCTAAQSALGFPSLSMSRITAKCFALQVTEN